MRIHYLQHVSFEGLGYIDEWASNYGHPTTRTAIFSEETFPELSTFDCLVVMGGPMGVDDISQYPWLTLEKRFIERVIRSGKQVLGVCLGAQLIAQVLGARVFKNTEKEIGWHPVSRTKSVEVSLMRTVMPVAFQAFHWHGDTFDLPSGANHLAQSEACRNQAFSYGDNVIGFQFHLESTLESIDLLIGNCGHELIPGKYIQCENEIRAHSELTKPSNTHMCLILEFIRSRHNAGKVSG